MDDMSINLTEHEAKVLEQFLADEVAWLNGDEDVLTAQEIEWRDALVPVVARLRRVLKMGVHA